MQIEQERQRLGYRGSIGSRAQGYVVKVLTVVGAGFVLAGAVAVSIVLFAVALAALVVLGTYVWWKLRKFRKQPPAQFARGDVIEGVVVREVRSQDRSAR